MSAAFNIRFAMSLVMLVILGLVVACGGAASDEAGTTTDSPSGADATVPPTATQPPSDAAEIATPVALAGNAPLMLRAPEDDPKRGGILQWAGLSDSPHFDMHQCNTAACAQPQGPFFDNLLRYSRSTAARKSCRTWPITGRYQTTVSSTPSISAMACCFTMAQNSRPTTSKPPSIASSSPPWA